MASLTETIMAGLADGTACFEYVDTTQTPSSFSLPFASISSAFSGSRSKKTSQLFFARRAMWQKEPDFDVHPVVRDKLSMFRALALGKERNKNKNLNATEEKEEADNLLIAVYSAICDENRKKVSYAEAVNGIKVEESLKQYCHRLDSSDFRGGDSELKILSKMLGLHIVVYEAKQAGYILKAEYAEYTKPTRGWTGWIAPKPVRLLYNASNNHYDLLI